MICFGPPSGALALPGVDFGHSPDGSILYADGHKSDVSIKQLRNIFKISKSNNSLPHQRSRVWNRSCLSVCVSVNALTAEFFDMCNQC